MISTVTQVTQSGALCFDAKTHVYSIDGHVIPNISRVIADVDPYPRDLWAAMEKKRPLGQAAHRACELDDLQKLDEDSVHPVIRSYLDAWRSFRRDKGFVPMQIEQRLYSRVHFFAGTPDRIGHLNGGDLTVLELKCVHRIRPVTQLQTAGQMILAEEWLGGQIARCALQLRPDGSYRYCHFGERADRKTFLAALQVYQWRRRYVP